MSVSFLPGIGFTLTLPDATTIVPVDDIAYGAGAQGAPDNCRTLVVYNMDANSRVLLKFWRTEEVNPAEMVLANCMVLPTSSSITYEVGYLGDRPSLSQAGEANLYLLAEAGVNLQVNITYLQGRGSNLF
ncbi:hypothetical protein CMI37_19015 [Candidatus Pacearchaeota archaeon]|nr:hypothetical protein [Candidatus Pacearchaeota archaeon]|tara:strand:+ start:1083 stop:1472 length:390 start_codon:yes stop_codon:yes gene_type:complete